VNKQTPRQSESIDSSTNYPSPTRQDLPIGGIYLAVVTGLGNASRPARVEAPAAVAKIASAFSSDAVPGPCWGTAAQRNLAGPRPFWELTTAPDVAGVVGRLRQVPCQRADGQVPYCEFIREGSRRERTAVRATPAA